MASRNGKTVFDLLTDGWKRTVTNFNGTQGGSIGVSIPADYADEHAITAGDDVAVKKQAGDAPVLELHFNPDTEDSEE